MIRRWWAVKVFLVALAMLLIAGNLLSTPVAKALSCDGWYGRNCWWGYFNNGYQQWGSDVIIGGLDAGDKPTFIANVLASLNSGDAHRITAAQFIILTMSGAGNAKSVSQAQIDDWESRVNNPAVTFVREDALFQCNIANSFYQDGLDDIAAGYSTPAEGCGANNTMLDFYVNGALVYRIRVACANPLGNPGVLPGLPPGVPPTVVSCGAISNVVPARPEVGDTMNVTATVNYSGGPPTPTPANWSMSVSGVGDVGVTAVWQGGNTYYLRSGNFTVPSTARYSVSWRMQVNGVWTNPNPCGGTFTNGDSFDVYNYPYIDVEGGDTAAGARFATGVGQPCAASDTQAGVVNWNKDGNPTYSGGGGQYGVSAFNWIEDFLSNKGNPNGASYGSLSFAGINVNQPAGQYGGFFGKGPCVDYWSKAPGSGQSLPNPNNQSLNSLSGVYVRNGDLTIDAGGNASRIPAGTKLTIYVTGNVSIRGNGGGGSITYGGTPNPNVASWTDLSEIPNFKLIVHGSIFIESNVDQLDGDYIAVPNPGYETALNRINAPNAGTISTCSSGFSALSPAVNPANINTCRRRLIVNGSFAANTVYFLRTIGSMSNGTPAEQFNYSPDVWLSPDSEGTIDPAYQSIIGLPPVL